jgi:hypothetical protein
LIARYAAAAPPGTRAREQAARVQVRTLACCDFQALGLGLQLQVPECILLHPSLMWPSLTTAAYRRAHVFLTEAHALCFLLQDVGSLRLSSAPGSMQIRIAGLPVVPMSPQSGMQTPQPGLPPFHRQQQAAAVEQQQQQQQQQQDAVFQPLQAATHPGGSEDLTPMDAAAAEVTTLH